MKHWDALSWPILITGGTVVLLSAGLTFYFGVIADRPGLALVLMGIGAFMFWRLDQHAKLMSQPDEDEASN